jgi:sigma-B regulation protein RsbU (phosphoserine phosphatase)
LGILPDFAFAEETILLEAGDLLLIVSDGVTEAMNGKNEQYSSSRLEALVAAHRHRSIRELTKLLLDDIRTHVNGAEQFDDISIVACRRLPLS